MNQEQKFQKKIRRIKSHVPKPLGSARMRNNARKRTAIWLHTDTWIVTGGRTEHTVIAGTYNHPDTFKCDCGISDSRPDHLCSHILAVMWEM